MSSNDNAYPEGNQPAAKSDSREGLGDDGGTRVGRGDASDDKSSQKRSEQDAGEQKGGSEAMRGTGGTAAGHQTEHRSKYGGGSQPEEKKQ